MQYMAKSKGSHTKQAYMLLTVKILDPKWPLLSHPLTPRFFTTHLSNVKALDT